MIVELFGAPGSGKTALTPIVLEFARHNGLRAYEAVEAARVVARRTWLGRMATWVVPQTLESAAQWRVYRVLSAVGTATFAVQRPRLVFHLVRTQRRRPPESDRQRRRVTYWFYRFSGSYQFFRSHLMPDEVVVFDEGFAHRAVQLFASSVERPDREQIDTYAGLLPNPDLLVYVDASEKVCLGRIQSRGIWPRLANKDEIEISRFVSNAHRAITLMVDQARRRGWPQVEVDNDDVDLVAASSQLRARLGHTAALASPHDA